MLSFLRSRLVPVVFAGIVSPPKGDSLKNAFGSPALLVAQACNAATWIFAAAIIASVIFALLAAFDYMRSAGDPAMVKKASNRLLYAGIGVAVALAAFLFPGMISTLIQAGTLGKAC